MFSISYDGCFTLVDTYRHKELPDGGSQLERVNLNAKFPSIYNNSLCQLKAEYQSLKLTKNKYPEIYVTKLEKCRYNSTTNLSVTSEKGI